MNGKNDMQPPVSAEDLRRYEEGWTKEMMVYWRERMLKLGIYRTGALYRSITGTLNGQTIEHRFLQYGIYVAAGVGKGYEVDGKEYRNKKGEVVRIGHNKGDLAFLKDWKTNDKHRKKRDWFSRKYYSSVMRLSEFEASYYGQAYNGLLATALQEMFGGKGTLGNL